MEKYSKYKDSGVKWIGDIPKHWEVLRAKNMFVRMSREVRNEDDVITCFRDGEVTLRKNRRIEGFTESFKEIGYQGIRKGDLVIHQMDAFAGSIGVSDSDGKGTPVYICLQPKGNYSNNYYAYLLREMARAGFIKSLYRGIRERSSDFRYETFAKLFLPIPPLAEQRAIVSYLDGKVGQIDTYVAKQTQQIELLKELKQAVIANAVTKGIDKMTKLKQTGVSWIGSVPLHWERCRCKDVLTETKLLVGDGQHTLLSLTTNGVIVRDLSEGKGKFPKDFNTYKVVKPNDLVFCLFDVDETPRTVGLVHNHGMLTGAYNVFETINVDTSFLYHYFIALDNRKALKSLYKGLRKVIPLPAFMSMPLYLPPLSEQRAIVSYIEAQTSNIDKLIDAYQQQVERIKEYKQRLISDAVTGKINVTGKQTQTN